MSQLVKYLDELLLPLLYTVSPAVTVSVALRGQVIFQHAWGSAEHETNVSTTTLFDLASLTKLYTTTALLVLLGRNDLPLSTPVVELLPEFGELSPRAIDGGQDPHTKRRLAVPAHLMSQTVRPEDVTLWHLLTHTSGLPPWRDVYDLIEAPAPPNKLDAHSGQERWQRGLKWMVQLPFVNYIGKAIRYSDIGLMLAGEVAARLNGTPLDTAVVDHVFDPIGVSHTVYNPVREHGMDFEQIAPTEIDATWRKRRVWGEVHDENACGVGGVAGHAGLFAPVGDVLRFGVAWQQKSQFDLPEYLWAQATTEQVAQDGERRGIGWMLRSFEGSSAGDLMSTDAYGHSGFTGTSLWIDPQRELVVALLTNRVYMGREVPGIHGLRRAVHDVIVREIDKSYI